MKNAYRHLAALSLAALSLSSCSRANYSFNSAVPAYLGTTPTATAPRAHAATAPLAAATPVAPAPAAPVAQAEQPAASRPAALATTSAPAAAPTQVAPAAINTSTIATARAAKPNLVQRIAMHKVLKRLTKMEARQQNTAGTTHTAAKASAYLGLAAVGLALLIIGLIVGSGFLDTLGGIFIVVGLIIFIFNNL